MKNSIHSWAARLLRTMSFDRRAARLQDREEFVEFLAGRAAQIAQTTLYTYLKARMGTRFPTYFEDDTFRPAILVARRQVFEACLADLTLWTVAVIARQAGWDARHSAKVATACFGDAHRVAMAEVGEDLPHPQPSGDFAARAASADWAGLEDPMSGFDHSAETLVAAVPVVEAFRAEDREVLINSMKFRWPEIWRTWHRRADLGALARSLGGG